MASSLALFWLPIHNLEFVENEYHKGSGVWGRELDEGMLLYALSVLVEKEVSAISLAGCVRD